MLGMGRWPVSFGLGILCFSFIMGMTSLSVLQMQSTAGSSDDNIVKGTNVVPTTQQQIQGQFPRYENPTLGISVQHPSDWLLVGESDDKLNFLKDNVAIEIDVDDLDPSDTTLSDYANEAVDDLREDRDDFELIEFEPVTISNGQPAQKAVYSFTGEDGEVINVIRIWSVYQGKLYSIAYIADSNEYDQYLPIAQEMIDSFEIVGAKQIGSGDRNFLTQNTEVYSSGAEKDLIKLV
jgi:PsbP-like protein